MNTKKCSSLHEPTSWHWATPKPQFAGDEIIACGSTNCFICDTTPFTCPFRRCEFDPEEYKKHMGK